MTTRKRATLSHPPTHITKTEQLTLKNELKILEVEIGGHLKELGYDA